MESVSGCVIVRVGGFGVRWCLGVPAGTRGGLFSGRGDRGGRLSGVCLTSLTLPGGQVRAGSARIAFHRDAVGRPVSQSRRGLRRFSRGSRASPATRQCWTSAAAPAVPRKRFWRSFHTPRAGTGLVGGHGGTRPRAARRSRAVVVPGRPRPRTGRAGRCGRLDGGAALGPGTMIPSGRDSARRCGPEVCWRSSAAERATSIASAR
jgi:hypothetical protein